MHYTDFGAEECLGVQVILFITRRAAAEHAMSSCLASL